MKNRPGMFTTDHSLAPLETLLHGYCACLNANEIKEEYEGRAFHPRDFACWLFDDLGWSGSLGFANAIEENSESPNASFQKFFELVHHFRYGEMTT